MWWTMTKKELVERDKKQREAIELWAETTDWPAHEKRAVVELAVGFDKAKFMSYLPSAKVYRLMALCVLRRVAGEHLPEDRRKRLRDSAQRRSASTSPTR